MPKSTSTLSKDIFFIAMLFSYLKILLHVKEWVWLLGHPVQTFIQHKLTNEIAIFMSEKDIYHDGVNCYMNLSQPLFPISKVPSQPPSGA